MARRAPVTGALTPIGDVPAGLEAMVAAGVNWLRCVHADDRRTLEAAVRAGTLGEAPLEYRIDAGDDAWRWVRETWRGRDGAVQVTLELLARQQTRVLVDAGFALDALPDAAIAIDLHGRMTLINARAAQLFGYAAAELRGRPIEVLVPFDATERHQAYVRRFLRRGASSRRMGQSSVVWGRCADGRTIPVEVSISAFPGSAAGAGAAGLAIIRDVAFERDQLRFARLVSAVRAERDTLTLQTIARLVGQAFEAGGFCALLLPHGMADVWLFAGGEATRFRVPTGTCGILQALQVQGALNAEIPQPAGDAPVWCAGPWTHVTAARESIAGGALSLCVGVLSPSAHAPGELATLALSTVAGLVAPHVGAQRTSTADAWASVSGVLASAPIPALFWAPGAGGLLQLAGVNRAASPLVSSDGAHFAGALTSLNGTPTALRDAARDARLMGVETTVQLPDGKVLMQPVAAGVIGWVQLEQRPHDLSTAPVELRMGPISLGLGVGVFVTDAKGNLREVNPHFLAQTGGSLGAVRGEGWFDQVCGRDRDWVRAAWRRTVRGGLPFDAEFGYTDAAAERWVRVEAVPQTHDGRLIGYLGTFRDISAERRMKQELVRTSRGLREAQRIARLSGWELDVVTGGVWLSAQARLAFDLERVEHPTLDDVLATLHPEDAHILTDMMDTVRGAARVECEHRLASGRVVQQTGEVVCDAAGRPERLVLCMQDIANRKQREARAGHADKIRALGQLAGGVAHDFSNVLTVLHGCVELLEGHVQDGEPAPVLQRELDVMRDATARASRLTGQLLSFAKRRPGRVRIVDVNAAVLDLQAMLSRVVGPGVEVALSTGAGDMRAAVDLAQLEQAVVNLAVNGRDAMEGKGQLVLSTRVLTGAGEHAVVELAVSDTGPGIDAALLPRLFEPFFTTKSSEEGTGLGLATVAAIVADCGGTVHVDSTPGAGSTFAMRFPRVGTSGEAGEPPSHTDRGPAPD